MTFRMFFLERSKINMFKNIEEKVKVNVHVAKFYPFFSVVKSLDTTIYVIGSTLFLNNKHYLRVTDRSFFLSFIQTLLFGGKEALSLNFSEEIYWIYVVYMYTILKR